MADIERRITRADVFLALGRKPVTSGGETHPLGGRLATPEEEIRFGDQLRRKLHDYKAPIMEARDKVFRAMAGS